MGALRYDLGGIGRGRSRQTVNLIGNCDLHHDFTQLDSFCADNSVDEFFLSHALEHVPTSKFKSFLHEMHRKLRSGGFVRVVQSDIKSVLRMMTEGTLSFRVGRAIIFPPADRIRTNILNQHFNMWGVQELMEDFTRCGFLRVTSFDAGSWRFDMTDELAPGDLEKFHGIKIPNLGIEAYK